MGKRRIVYGRKRHNKFSMFLVTVAVLMLLVVVTIKSQELQAKSDTNAAKVSALKTEIAAQELRSEELVELEKYTKTKKYAEDVAKDKLGLVYEGEIIFKSNN